MEDIVIGIVFGGNSIEREYSVEASKYLDSILSNLQYKTVLIDIIHDSDYLYKLSNNKISIAFSVLYGCPGQEGTIQGIFELLNIPYVGSDLYACSIIKDKVLAKRLLNSHGFLTPEYIDFSIDSYKRSKDIIIEEAVIKIGFPAVVKPVRKGGLSLGITYCDNRKDLINSIEEAFIYDDRIMIEKYIQGKEITSCVIRIDEKEEVLPLIEVVKDGFISNYEVKKLGKRNLEIPANINIESMEIVKKETLDIFKVLNMRDFGYFDYILQNESLFFIEAGAVPGFCKTSNIPKALEFLGKDIGTVINNIIKNRLKGVK